MMDEITGLFTKSDHPCDVEFNRQLKKFIPCPDGINTSCNECVWEKQGDTGKKLMSVIPILILED